MLNLFPFLSHYEQTTFVTLSSFIESAIMFFPAGFVFHFIPSDSRSPRAAILLITLIIAVPLEPAQGVIMERYPDVTDLLGALLGAFAGSWCCLEGWRAFNRFIKPAKKS